MDNFSFKLAEYIIRATIKRGAQPWIYFLRRGWLAGLAAVFTLHPTAGLAAASSDATLARDNINTDMAVARNTLETTLVGGADYFYTDDTASAVKQLAQAAQGEATAKTARQGTDLSANVRLQLNMDEDFHLDGSAIDLLAPFYDSGDTLLFTQLGARRKDGRSTLNPGVGARLVLNNWLYGLNAFFDDDITGNNRRLGFGAEIRTHFVKLSSNLYYRLSEEHSSSDFTQFDERPAGGYDMRGEAYLPFFPQLGAEMIFEKYYGDGVALFDKNVRLDSPRALTVGLTFTPIPLLTLAADRREGSGDQAENRFSVQINYRLGQPWREQFDPRSVAVIRTLAVSRYDPVERNSKAILNYLRQN